MDEMRTRENVALSLLWHAGLSVVIRIFNFKPP
jgi:hypothetical protein